MGMMWNGIEDVEKLMTQIKAGGMRAGLALKPSTPLEAVLPYAGNADMVLVMTVEPGFGGQEFMHEMMPKANPHPPKSTRSALSLSLSPCLCHSS